MKNFILTFVVPQFVGVFFGFWLSDDFPEYRRTAVLLFLPCALLAVVVALWAARERFDFADVQWRIGAIPIGVCSSAVLALIGAADVINTRNSGWSAPVFRSGLFLVVYFGTYITFLLLYKTRLSKRQHEKKG